MRVAPGSRMRPFPRTASRSTPNRPRFEPEAPPRATIVISHSSRDSEAAAGVCKVLESRGLRCWIAPRDITPGEDWSAAIIDAISRAQVMILLYTSHSNRSQHVQREVERAVARGLHIVPLRVEDVPMSASLEYFISTRHWLNAVTPPLTSHLDQLADCIYSLLQGGPGVQEGEPAKETDAQLSAVCVPKTIADPEPDNLVVPRSTVRCGAMIAIGAALAVLLRPRPSQVIVISHANASRH